MELTAIGPTFVPFQQETAKSPSKKAAKEAHPVFTDVPTRDEIERIANEEFEHFRMLNNAITGLKGDPTAVTPSADLQATLGKGVLEAVVDPRTNLVQSLEAILIAELADNEAWEALTDLARIVGENSSPNASRWPRQKRPCTSRACGSGWPKPKRAPDPERPHSQTCSAG